MNILELIASRVGEKKFEKDSHGAVFRPSGLTPLPALADRAYVVLRMVQVLGCESSKGGVDKKRRPTAQMRARQREAGREHQLGGG